MSHPLRDLDKETLPVDEFLRLCALPVSAETIAATAELVTWFTRRYPTAKDRFDYIRRARARVI